MWYNGDGDIMNNILDMHGMDREYGLIALREFINDNIKMKNKDIVIIHGVGKGILRKMVLEELKNNKYVELYRLDFFNPGSTNATLNIKNRS